MPRESEIILRLKKLAPAADDLLVGIGDDAACIRSSERKDILACCDLMVEGVHFQMDWMPPRLLGRKALAINLSDIAAMGGVPKYTMLSVAFPPDCSSEFIDGLFQGMLEIASEHGVSLVGGDTSSSRDSLFIDVSLIGECARGNAVTRGGAKPGDVVYVSGSLGAAGLGLRLLENGIRLETVGDDIAKRTALMKHLAPEPKVKLGQMIGQKKLATAMIDISDGLSTDLSHILDDSRCGGIVRSAAIPIAECVLAASSQLNESDQMALALSSGEEYELCFTADPNSSTEIEEVSQSLGIALTPIGEIVEGRELRLERAGSLERIVQSGYEHLI